MGVTAWASFLALSFFLPVSLGLTPLACLNARQGSPSAAPWDVTSPLLQCVSAFRLYDDSKSFVDSPLLTSREVMWAGYNALPLPLSSSTLLSFVQAHFGAPGSDLAPCALPDFNATPPAPLQALRAPAVRHWASALHTQWPALAKCPLPSVRDHPSRHTLLYSAAPLVVPGGRFREAYLWDSLWICQGLVRSNMAASAQGIVQTLVELIARYGFIPNGGRSYYTDRSQPPVLSSMVFEVLRATGDVAWLADSAYQGISDEYAFWMEERAVVLRDPRAHALQHVLNRYHPSTSRTPRAESWREDIEAAREAGMQVGSLREQQLFMDISGAAESGWDFSSRWLEEEQEGEEGEQEEGDGRQQGAAEDSGSGSSSSSSSGAAESQGSSSSGSGAETVEAAAPPPQPAPPATTPHSHPSMASCMTSRVIPVDLNALLLVTERHLAEAAWTLAQRAAASACPREGYWRGEAARYAAAAEARELAMESLLWDEGAGSWKDLLLAGGGEGGGGAAAAPAPPPGSTRSQRVRETGRWEHSVAGNGSSSGSGSSDGERVFHARAFPGGPWVPPLPAAAAAPTPFFTHFARVPASRPSLSDFLPLYAGLGGGSGLAGAAGWQGSALRPSYLPSTTNSTSSSTTNSTSSSSSSTSRTLSPAAATAAATAATAALPQRNATRLRTVLSSLQSSGLLGAGGFLSTTARSGQQWDAPNAWSPLQDMMVEGLRGTGGAEGRALAREGARRWLANSLATYAATGSMHEKLRGDVLGVPGDGGEYDAVKGPFGWSNGVALKLSLDYDFEGWEVGVGEEL